MQIGLGLALTTKNYSQKSLASRVQELFKGFGAWYDPYDLNSLYQDSDGLIPVTSVEQPVGKMLDKSGAGNHAVQATAGKRPVVSRRVNLLLATEVLATQTVALKAGNYSLAFQGEGSVELSGVASGVYTAGVYPITATAGVLTLTVIGEVLKGSLVPEAFSALPYQRVTTATDYDTDGSFYPTYLKQETVGAYLQVPSVSLNSSDALTVAAAVRKLADSNIGTVFESSSDSAATNGTFGLFTRNAAEDSGYTFNSRGSALSTADTPSWYYAPSSDAVVAEAKISTDYNNIRSDGEEAGQSADDQGVGNYIDSALYLMNNQAETKPLDGWFCAGLVLNRNLTEKELALVEVYLFDRLKTGSVIPRYKLLLEDGFAALTEVDETILIEQTA